MAGIRLKAPIIRTLQTTTTVMAVSGAVELINQPTSRQENGRAVSTIANEVPLILPGSSSGVRE